MRRRAAAEFVGTCVLLFTIVGSGIVAQELSDDRALQLLAHAIAVGAGIAVLIAILAPVSGAHLNPVVTFVFWRNRALSGRTAMAYVVGQTTGALAGVILAHASFDRALLSISTTGRDGLGRGLAEAVSTFVLVLLIVGLAQTDRSRLIPWAVGGWVATAILATSSTGFANPAVTLARSATNTFAGIAPSSLWVFIVAQAAGAILAIATVGFMFSGNALSFASTESREESLV